MTSQPKYRGFVVLAMGLLLAMVLGLQAGPSPQAGHREEFPKPTFNDKGELIRPDISYREWVYVGTPLTPNELNPPEAPFPEFHNVYIHPDDFDHWKRPWVTAPEADTTPSEMSLDSFARLLTVKEKVPEEASLVVVMDTTSLLSAELLLENTP